MPRGYMDGEELEAFLAYNQRHPLQPSFGTGEADFNLLEGIETLSDFLTEMGDDMRKVNPKEPPRATWGQYE